jgi:hypothetical protein
MLVTGQKRRISVRFPTCLTAMALTFQISQAHAIEGGALARANDQLARATVAVGTVLQPGADLRYGLHAKRCGAIPPGDTSCA